MDEKRQDREKQKESAIPVQHLTGIEPELKSIIVVEGLHRDSGRHRRQLNQEHHAHQSHQPRGIGNPLRRGQ